MDEQEKINKIKSLSFEEAGVLYYKLAGKSDYQITEDLHISTSKMYNLQRVAFDKLEIPAKKGEEKQRWPYFRKEFGDVFSSLLPDADSLKNWPMKGYKEETPPPEPTPEPTPEPLPPSSSVRAIPPKTPRRPPTWLLALMACSVLGVIAIIAFVLAIILIREIRPAYQIPPTHIPLPTSESAVVVQPLVPTNTIQPTSPPLPTDTLVPTNTMFPTNTPYPTNTPKPSISLPFRDNFSNGINPPWYAYSGTWMTTGSGATITTTDFSAPAGALILDDPTLSNYRLRVNVHSPHVLSACQGDLGVIIRYQANRDINLIFWMNSASRFYWGYTAGLNPDFGSVTNVTDVTKANIISDFIMELEASGNTFTARIDGEKYDHFSLTGYETGGVVLISVCGCPGSCPSFSNFSLEAIP